MIFLFFCLAASNSPTPHGNGRLLLCTEKGRSKADIKAILPHLTVWREEQVYNNSGPPHHHPALRPCAPPHLVHVTPPLECSSGGVFL